MKVTLCKEGIAINEKHEVLLCASLFYFRLPRETWQNRIDMLVATGYNTVDVYFPWNFHEVKQGEWDFGHDKDADTFLKMLREAGLYIVARPGPYICSEWDGGALPSWINEQYNIRSNNDKFMAQVGKWYDKILPIIHKHEYDGHGGVVLVQLDNELDFFDCPDPNSYIEALKSMALSHNLQSPLFCCAGQLNAYRAGGLAKGVVPTYNFYPNSLDSTYDHVFRFYNDALAIKNLPFLITETNRDHFLLRREFASGAKLLGAYNQVAGTNFGFTASINNWGKPLSFLATDYDFDSMITSAGEYSVEAKKAKVFASFLKAMGDRVAKAVAYSGDIQYKVDNMIRPDSLNALQSPDGGIIVCCPNFSDKVGTMEVTVDAITQSIAVQPQFAPFIMFNVNFSDVLVSANCEPYSYKDNTLTFVKTSDSNIKLVKDGKQVDLKSEGEAFGLKINFIALDQAEKIAGGYGFSSDLHNIKSIDNCLIEDVELDYSEVIAKDGFNFTALGLSRGYAKYSVQSDMDKEIFIEDVADVITAQIDSEYCDTRIATGSCEIYPKTSSGQSSFVVEKWGHCNFDDARLKSMRIASTKGISNAYSIQERSALTYAEFTLLDEFDTKKLPKSLEEIPSILKTSQWNTTRIPVVCAYKFIATKKYDKLYIKLKTNIECIVYLNGSKVGRADYGYVDLSVAPKDKVSSVTLVFRKLDWAADCGTAELIQLKSAKVSASTFSQEDMAQIKLTTMSSQEASLPLKLVKGKQFKISMDIPKDSNFMAQALLIDAKATFMCGGKVIARVMGDWDLAPPIVGGAKDKFYLPKCWNDGKLIVYVEAVGDNAQLTALNLSQVLGNQN